MAAERPAALVRGASRTQAVRPLALYLLGADAARVARWRRLFSAQGWPVETALDCDELRRIVTGCRQGAVMVDLKLLRGGRLAALKDRAPQLVWIVIGTAGPLDGPEAARCLDEGAEDYLPSDIDERILVAKLRSHVRRLLPRYADETERVRDPAGTLMVDRAARSFSTRDAKGKWATHDSLTDLEARILWFFIQRPDVLLETRAILEGVWLDRADRVQPETVGRHVEHLRQKLGQLGKRIQMVYGRGYVFRSK